MPSFKVGEHKITYGPADSTATIRARVAQAIRIPAIYLSFEPALKFPIMKKYAAGDIRDRLGKIPRLNEELLVELKSQWTHLTKLELALIWLRLRYPEQLPEEQKEEILTLFAPLLTTRKRRVRWENIIKEHSKIITLEGEEKKWIPELRRIDALNQVLEGYEEQPSSSLLINQIGVEVVITSPLPLMRLLDKLHLNIQLPFAYATLPYQDHLKTIFKVRSDLVLPVKWVPDHPISNQLVFYYQVKPGNIFRVENFTRCTITADIPGFYRLIFQAPTEGKDEDEIVASILDRWPSVLFKTASTIHQSFSVDFLMPYDPIDQAIFLHALSNDPFMSEIIYPYETTNLASKKTRMFMKFYSNSINDIFTNVMVSSGWSNNNQPEINRLEPKEQQLFAGDTPYLRWEINRVPDLDTAEQIKNILVRLLSYYEDHKKDIASIYQIYIPKRAKVDAPQKRRKGTRETEILRQKAPDLFLANYARIVQKNRPTIISKKEAKLARARGQNVMKFPLYGEGPTRYFACPEGYHPDLRKNTLPNAGVYPYVPKCFKYEKFLYKWYRDGGWDLVFANEAKKKKTDKILQHKHPAENGLSLLPSKIDTVFRFYAEDPDNQECYERFCRFGLAQSPLSGLHAVAYSLIDGYPDSYNERIYYVNSLFKKLRKKKVSILAPFFPGKSEDEIRGILSRKGFDIIVWRPMLEELYDIDIFIFSGDTNEIVPHLARRSIPAVHVNAIFVISHGHRGLCELIVKRTEDSIRAIFTGELNQELWALEDRMNRSKELLVTHDIVPVGLPFSQAPNAQSLDYNGNARSFLIGDVIVQTSPLPAQMLPTFDPIMIPEWDTVQDFLDKEKAEIIARDVRNGMTYGVQATIGGISCFVPCAPLETNDNLPPLYDYTLLLTDNSQSLLQERQQVRKTAQVLAEYALHEYVRSNLSLDQFFEERCIIIPDYQYVIHARFDKGDFYYKDRLVIPSENVQRRLKYHITQSMRRPKFDLEEETAREYLQTYYQTSDDYHPHLYEIIFDTLEALDNWKAGQLFLPSSHTFEVPPPQLTVFYLRHPSLEDGAIFLVRVFSDLVRALSYAKFWNDTQTYPAAAIANVPITTPYILYTVTVNDVVMEYHGASPILKIVTVGAEYGAMLNL